MLDSHSIRALVRILGEAVFDGMPFLRTMRASNNSTSLDDFACLSMKKPAAVTTIALALDEIITRYLSRLGTGGLVGLSKKDSSGDRFDVLTLAQPNQCIHLR